MYNLKDAARVWYKSVVGHIGSLGGTKSRLDPTIFIWKDERGSIIGVMCYVFFYGGNEEFTRWVIEKLKKLELEYEEKVNFKYMGVRVNQERERERVCVCYV